MSFLEDNLDKCKIGFYGEGLIRDWLKSKSIPFMQVDVMFYYNNAWCLGEVKTQEKYEAPPYDGHGLPKWQIDARLKFQQDTGVMAYLIVYDLGEKCIYIQTLDTLLKGQHFQTNGKNPRVVFDINSFTRFEI
jgi:hypothetical protein